MKELWNKYKRLILPNIKDFSHSYDNLKYENDWWGMPTMTWLIFHPVAYKWVFFGINLGSTLLFSFFTWLTYTKEIYYLSVIFVLIALRMGWATYKKVSTWKDANICNFYDMFFREYGK